MQSHSDISNIKPRHLLRYDLAVGTRFFSAALAQLDAAADTPIALIHRGEVTTRSKLRWSSVLMGLHSVFVFLGWQNLGRSGLAFSYGLPWSTKACVVLALLVALRGQTDISRQQALDAYAAELEAVNFRLSRFGACSHGLRYRAWDGRRANSSFDAIKLASG